MYHCLLRCVVLCRVVRHRRQLIEPEILAEDVDDDGKDHDEKGSEDEEESEEELDEEVKLMSLDFYI